MLKRPLYLGLLAFWLIFPAQAEESYRRLPWHLVDIRWTLEAGVEKEPFKEFILDVGIDGEPGEALSFFISPFTFGFINGPMVYGGLQTHVWKLPLGKKRGLIFSRWGERREDFIRPADDGAWQSAGYEGDFISTRAPLLWRAGQHQMRLTYRPAEKPADSPNHWVGFSFCLEMTECRSAGELGFADSKPRMPRNFISFVEIYGKNTDLSALQNFSVTFSHPRLNGRSVRIESVEAFFPPDIPAIARVMRIDPMTVKIEIGKSDDRGQFRTDKHKNKFQSLP